MRAPTLLCLCLVSCSSSEGDDDVPDDLDVIAVGAASGTISNMPFTVGTRFMNISSNELFVDLLPVAAADCTLDETDGHYPFIIFFVPNAPGTYRLGPSRSVTFVSAPSNNLIVSKGVIQIDAINANAVVGGLHVFDAEFGEVNGRFDGQLCFSN